MKLPDDRRYSSEHIWVKKDREVCIAGITDYAQAQLGQIVFVDLPAIDKDFKPGAEFGSIESVKAVSQLFMPLAGKIAAVNTEVESDPAQINNDCYGKGWLVKFSPADWASYEKLLDREEYRKLLEAKC